jgi:hypothetical protein
MSPIKELHVFDALFMPECFDVFIRQAQNKVKRALETGMPDPKRGSAHKATARDLTDRLSMYDDLGNYSKYFMRLASDDGGAGHIKLVGEITPTYAALEAHHFQKIKELLRDDFNIKVIFLMRDPTDRIWSQQRMIEGRPGRSGLAVKIAPGRLNEDFYTDPKVVLRTAYERTIMNLEKAFAQEELFFGFYETLFSEKELMKLCTFLGIAYKEGDCKTRVNASHNPHQSPEITSLRAARAFYADTYDFCASRFSEGFIRSIWPYY